ncbi:MAG: hypothetical protein FJ137_01660 [Deltaproteobacteria bacterium]|nr:hypothetical protein [Deltaproteobacteria bacterium]
MLDALLTPLSPSPSTSLAPPAPLLGLGSGASLFGASFTAAAPAPLPAAASPSPPRPATGLIPVPAAPPPGAASSPRSSVGLLPVPPPAVLSHPPTGAFAVVPAAPASAAQTSTAPAPRSSSAAAPESGALPSPAPTGSPAPAPSEGVGVEPAARIAPKGDTSPGQLGAILKETRKALKNRLLYSHIEDHGEDQLLAIYGRLVRFLQAAGEISLRVEVSSFVWNDVEVFIDDGHDINFGYSLYRAGVRLVSLRPALVWEEFLAFWTLIASDLGEPHEEDLLTRLWRQGFDNIHWVAQLKLDDDEFDIEVQDFLDGTLTEAVQRFSPDQLREAWGAELTALASSFAQQAAAQGVLADDQRAVSAEQTRAERTLVLAGVAKTLLEITQLKAFAEAEEYFAEAFEQLAIAMLAERDAATLGALAEQAHALLQQPAGPVQDAAVKMGINGFVRALTSPKNIPQLRALLDDPQTALPPREFAALVRLLSAEGAPLLLTFLDGKLTHEPRSIVLRVLANASAEQAVHIARRMRNADERLALELLGVVSSLQVPRRVMLCEPALMNTSRLVRRTALETMVRCMDDPAAPQMLGRHLGRLADIDERIELIGAIARFDSDESARTFAQRLQQPELEARELTALWRGLLTAESPTAHAVVTRAAAEPTRGLLGSAKDETRKAALVEVLGEHADVRSARVLASITQDENLSSRALVKRAQDLLGALKARLGRTGGA